MIWTGTALPFPPPSNSQWLNLATNTVPHTLTSFKIYVASFLTVKREYSLLVGSCGVFSILLEEANILLTKGNL